jgi:hypothetical protein
LQPQESKAPLPMETESGRATDVRLEHSAKAKLPIEVTELGRATDGRLEHCVKA